MVPPKSSKNLWQDILYFFFHKPELPTLIKFESDAEKIDYSQRIMQRIGFDVDKYSVLNVHKIGVEVPVRYVFEELLTWDGNSTCWPNHIAQVERQNGKLEHIQIYFLRMRKYPFRLKNSFLGLKYIPLFNLNVLRFLHVPHPNDHDNARYLLFECSGGYPIGIFSMYVRSPISQLNESEQAQLFLAVGFNFYGKEMSKRLHPINWIWEKIHNRVTGNVLNRMKCLSEWKFQDLETGTYHLKKSDILRNKK
jgi:hypothetical protein